MRRRIFSFMIWGMLLMFSHLVQSAEVPVSSPDGKVTVVVSANEAGQLEYLVKLRGKTVLENSPLGVTVDDVPLGSGVTINKPRRFNFKETYPWRGVHSTAVNHYELVMIPVQHTVSQTRYMLEVRVFDTGVGYRYIIPGSGSRKVSSEASAFVAPKGSVVWFQTNTNNYERPYQKYALADIKKDTYLGPPMVVVLPNKLGYAAISEAALFNYSGMTIKAVGEGSPVFESAFQDDKSWTIDGTITTPWRVIMVSKDLNGLVNCDIIWNLCPAPSKELASADWIKPGRALWHWWSGKIGNWDSVAYQLQKGWIDATAEFGFEYYLVDAGWEHTWEAPGKDKWAHLKELCDYAQPKNVGVIVWKRWKSGKTEGIIMAGLDDDERRRDFFKRCHEAGVVGIKIDYMDSESKERVGFYEEVLQDAVKYKIMVNFHGANKPTGESRTWPNEVTREGIQGLEYNKWSKLLPSHYASLPFTRYLVGHGDFTPGTFNPKMLKGTTFALQLASAICFTSPVMHWADQPDMYRKSGALDVIKAIPSVWDETRVLPGSEIGELAVMARRKGKIWFVGIINGSASKSKSYKLDLSFLGSGSYQAKLLGDDPKRPDAFVRQAKKVVANDSVAVKLNPGGGFVGMFQPE